MESEELQVQLWQSKACYRRREGVKSKACGRRGEGVKR